MDARPWFALVVWPSPERKQDVLYVCFYMLLNLSEDPSVERKMKKRNIGAYLCRVLERRSVDLLVLATTFLKKLSVTRENVDQMLDERGERRG